MNAIKPIYSFEVITNIREGKTVCVCDRVLHTCDYVGGMPLAEVLRILDNKEEENRYDFWIEEEAEEVSNG